MSIILFKKKERRKRGIEYMFNIKDDVLVNYRPVSLSDKDFKEDLKDIIVSG